MWQLYDTLIDGIDTNRKVDRAVHGQWRACVSSGGSAGLSSVIRPIGASAPISESIDSFKGKSLKDMATLVKSWDFKEAALGLAALNAYYNDRNILPPDSSEIYSLGTNDGDIFEILLPEIRDKKVGVIGHFRGLRELYQDLCRLYIFEREPKPGDYPDPAEEFLLPEMDIVIITGMTLTNKTLPRILQLSSDAKVVLTGPSSALAPCLSEFGVDMLSGMLVDNVEACLNSVMNSSYSMDFFQYARKVIVYL
ncbi:MAG: hypothetical protein IJG63_07220 [Oscillospiraceae bacterium]|nr:hypothetical protein [Oscillospiraceae bacterium]